MCWVCKGGIFFLGRGWRRFVCLPQHLLDFVRTFNNFWTQNQEQFFEPARALRSRIQSNNFSVWGVHHYRSRQVKQGKSLVNKSFPQGSRLLSILLMEKKYTWYNPNYTKRLNQSVCNKAFFREGGLNFFFCYSVSAVMFHLTLISPDSDLYLFQQTTLAHIL